MSNDTVDLNADRIDELEAKVEELERDVTLGFMTVADTESKIGACFDLQLLFTVIAFALALASFCMSLWLIVGQG